MSVRWMYSLAPIPRIPTIDTENQLSIKFHEKLGFVQVGKLSQIGFKFGQWLDVVYMQKYIDV